MTELLRNLSGEQTVGLIAVVLGIFAVTTVVVTAIVVPMRHATRRAELEAQLKQDLIAGNYSAADIERILAATSQENCVKTVSNYSARR